MEKISVKNVVCKSNCVEINLGENYNISHIKISNLSCGFDKITVKYAQNNVVSDLIFFDEGVMNADTGMEFLKEIPVAASDIYIFCDNPKQISVELFGEKADVNAYAYPLCRDIYLDDNYYLDTVSVFTGGNGYSHYSIYTSINDRDFSFLAEKKNNLPCNPETGDVYNAYGREARVIRIYYEYNSASPKAEIENVLYTGRKSGTAKEERPPIDVVDFKDSPYNVVITQADTYAEVYGIIERQLGAQYKSWFDLKLSDNPIIGHSCDYFELDSLDGKILITANSGVCLACGLNHYLKYYCNVNISQLGKQNKMPEHIVYPEHKVFKETKAKVRYAYNYCTLSYTMAFWGEKEWRNELDWLALNGVNVVLDITAQEEVWRRFLKSIGYSHQDIRRFIAGPAYYAWAYMANLYGYGGPVHDSWFSKRTDLARKNQLIMRKLGMQPVLQGYSGMVPVDINDYDKNAEIILQGTWCGYTRPAMLKTTSPCFGKYASAFYKAQNEVYGENSIYFATDPFHEGGNVGNMSLEDISYGVLGSMLESNENAVWIIQSWQGNPQSELLVGAHNIKDGKDHILILDLYGEKEPNYNNGHENNPYHGYSKEFDASPWVFCNLNNFGGRLGLHGHLDILSKQIPEVFNSCSHICGIGITPEASFNNPVIYDFLFDSIWQDNADEALRETNLSLWIERYILRRYGSETKASKEAWKLLAETVYKAGYNNLGQGAPECIFNARPDIDIKAASTWGNTVISYDMSKLENAAELLLKDYNILCKSEAYLVDLSALLQQVLSNKCLMVYEQMEIAYKSKNINEFKKQSRRFIELGDYMEVVMGNSAFTTLGNWINQAVEACRNADEFSKKLYLFNAKALITTWGAYNQSEIGGLHDYSNRQWSGLISDFYKVRWELWINERLSELQNKIEKIINWFEWEWNWARGSTLYPTTPAKTDLKLLGENILGL